MQTYGIKYIGSKASLVEKIIANINRHLQPSRNLKVIDVFTGTTRVGQAFRSLGWSVQSSDLAWAAEAYAHAFLIRTSESGARIPEIIEKLRSSMLVEIESYSPDWISNTYCDVSGIEGTGSVRMWKPKNGLRADYYRNKVQEMFENGEINRHELMILITCIIFALDKVDNSVGVQQAYLKDWAKRTDDRLELRDLSFYDGPVGKHYIGNCVSIDYEMADVAYLDPPYSNHSYSTYYHIWDSVTRWDKPVVSLQTNRRIDRVSKSSEFDTGMVSQWNSKRTALSAFIELCRRLPAKYLLISYNNESIIPLDTLTEALRAEFNVVDIENISYQRNIMSQIGNAVLYNDTFKTENTEVLIWIKVCA